MGLPRDQLPDLAHLVTAVGRLWQAGVEVDWTAFHGDRRPARTPLPGYPFEGRRYWVAAGRSRTADTVPDETTDGVDPPAEGFAAPRTQREREVARSWCDLLGL